MSLHPQYRHFPAPARGRVASILPINLSMRALGKRTQTISDKWQQQTIYIINYFTLQRKEVSTIARIKERKEGSISSTVQEAINTYLQSPHYKGLGARTQVVYAVDLRNFSQWCSTHTVTQNPKTKAWIVSEGDEPLLLHQVNDQVVRLYIEHYKARAVPKKPGATTLSTYTTKNAAIRIKAFLNWCSCDPEYSSQVQYVTIQRIEIPQAIETIIIPFTDEQVMDLLAACEKQIDRHLQFRDKAILAVMLDTGIRAHEVVTLKIGDVSLDANDAFIRVLGKRQKWGEVGLGEQSRRLLQSYLSKFRIPLLEDELLEEYKHLPSKQFKKVRDQTIAHEPVFMNRTAHQLTTTGLLLMFKRLGRMAHIEGVRCSPHTMRHKFAVNFWRRTHDIRTLSKLLRHSSIRTTEEYLKSILQSEARIGAPSMFDELQKGGKG